MTANRLRIIGPYTPWGPDVREGRLTRADDRVEGVLLRALPGLPGDAATLDALYRHIALLSRVSHPAILRPLTATSFGGMAAYVYPYFNAVSLALVLSSHRERQGWLPMRVCVGIAAAAAQTLAAAVDNVERMGGLRALHTGPSSADVLIAPDGAVLVSGLWILGPDQPLPVASSPGYTPPEGMKDARSLAYGLGALTLEILSGAPPPESSEDTRRHDEAMRTALNRLNERPGEPVPPSLGRLLRLSLSGNSSIRPSLSGMATQLAQLAAAQRGPDVAAWANAAISRLLGARPELESPGAQPSEEAPPRRSALPVAPLPPPPAWGEGPPRALGFGAPLEIFESVDDDETVKEGTSVPVPLGAEPEPTQEADLGDALEEDSVPEPLPITVGPSLFQAMELSLEDEPSDEDTVRVDERPAREPGPRAVAPEPRRAPPAGAFGPSIAEDAPPPRRPRPPTVEDAPSLPPPLVPPPEPPAPHQPPPIAAPPEPPAPQQPPPITDAQEIPAVAPSTTAPPEPPQAEPSLPPEPPAALLAEPPSPEPEPPKEPEPPIVIEAPFSAPPEPELQRLLDAAPSVPEEPNSEALLPEALLPEAPSPAIQATKDASPFSEPTFSIELAPDTSASGHADPEVTDATGSETANAEITEPTPDAGPAFGEVTEPVPDAAPAEPATPSPAPAASKPVAPRARPAGQREEPSVEMSATPEDDSLRPSSLRPGRAPLAYVGAGVLALLLIVGGFALKGRGGATEAPEVPTQIDATVGPEAPPPEAPPPEAPPPEAPEPPQITEAPSAPEAPPTPARTPPAAPRGDDGRASPAPDEDIVPRMDAAPSAPKETPSPVDAPKPVAEAPAPEAPTPPAEAPKPPVEPLKPAAVAAPAEPFTATFRIGDPAVQSMTVKCNTGSASGSDPVVVSNAQPGPCRVQGSTEAGGVVAFFDLRGPGDFTCFEGGSRSCK